MSSITRFASHGDSFLIKFKVFETRLASPGGAKRYRNPSSEARAKQIEQQMWKHEKTWEELSDGGEEHCWKSDWGTYKNL